MNGAAVLAQKIYQDVQELPEESLLEVAKFIEFLRFKVRGTEKFERQAPKSRRGAPAPARPVATYTVDGSEVIVTEADMAAVRTQLTRPHSPVAVRELALAYKLAEQENRLPEEEQDQRFWEDVEAIRAEAIATGTAIDEPAELLTDD